MMLSAQPLNVKTTLIVGVMSFYIFFRTANSARQFL